jgi:hypothetical protein
MLRELRQEVLKMIQAATAKLNAGAGSMLALQQSHAFVQNTAAVSVSTAAAAVLASLTVTPKATGKFRMIASGTMQNGSTVAANFSAAFQTATTTGAAASTVMTGPVVTAPGTSTVGFSSGDIPWSLVTETSSGVAQPVGVAGILQVVATPATTNVLNELAGTQLDIQEIL